MGNYLLSIRETEKVMALGSTGHTSSFGALIESVRMESTPCSKFLTACSKKEVKL